MVCVWPKDGRQESQLDSSNKYNYYKNKINTSFKKIIKNLGTLLYSS